MVDLDERVFPVAEFKGQWEPDDPPEWETFEIVLFGNEAGDYITDPPEIHKALEASGYRLTLEKIETQKERVMDCKKCRTEMKAGKATGQTVSGGIKDFESDARSITLSVGGPGVLIDCLKCPACGWSCSQ